MEAFLIEPIETLAKPSVLRNEDDIGSKCRRRPAETMSRDNPVRAEAHEPMARPSVSDLYERDRLDTQDVQRDASCAFVQ